MKNYYLQLAESVGGYAMVATHVWVATRSGDGCIGHRQGWATSISALQRRMGQDTADCRTGTDPLGSLLSNDGGENKLYLF